MKSASILFMTLLAMSASAGSYNQYKAYLIQNGVNPDDVLNPNKVSLVTNVGGSVEVMKWNIVTPVKPTEADLPAEQAAKQIVKENRYQNLPAKQKTLQIKYIALNDQVLAETGDPRLGQVPKVILSVDELEDLLEPFMDGNQGQANKAFKLSIKITTTSKQLDKIDSNWFRYISDTVTP